MGLSQLMYCGMVSVLASTACVGVPSTTGSYQMDDEETARNNTNRPYTYYDDSDTSDGVYIAIGILAGLVALCFVLIWVNAWVDGDYNGWCPITCNVQKTQRVDHVKEQTDEYGHGGQTNENGERY